MSVILQLYNVKKGRLRVENDCSIKCANCEKFAPCLTEIATEVIQLENFVKYVSSIVPDAEVKPETETLAILRFNGVI